MIAGNTLVIAGDTVGKTEWLRISTDIIPCFTGLIQYDSRRKQNEYRKNLLSEDMIQHYQCREYVGICLYHVLSVQNNNHGMQGYRRFRRVCGESYVF